MVKILLTGYTDVGALIEAINCGLVYRYLTKPWNNDDLRITVSRALEHYELIKSKHILEMVNQRLRVRLGQIGELATEGLEEAAAFGSKNSAEMRVAPTKPEVYELLG